MVYKHIDVEENDMYINFYDVVLVVKVDDELQGTKLYKKIKTVKVNVSRLLVYISGNEKSILVEDQK